MVPFPFCTTWAICLLLPSQDQLCLEDLTDTNWWACLLLLKHNFETLHPTKSPRWTATANQTQASKHARTQAGRQARRHAGTHARKLASKQASKQTTSLAEPATNQRSIPKDRFITHARFCCGALFLGFQTPGFQGDPSHPAGGCQGAG